MAYYNLRHLEKHQYRRQIESMSEGAYQGIACQERGGDIQDQPGVGEEGGKVKEYDDHRYGGERVCNGEWRRF